MCKWMAECRRMAQKVYMYEQGDFFYRWRSSLPSHGDWREAMWKMLQAAVGVWSSAASKKTLSKKRKFVPAAAKHKNIIAVIRNRNGACVSPFPPFLQFLSPSLSLLIPIPAHSDHLPNVFHWFLFWWIRTSTESTFNSIYPLSIWVGVCVNLRTRWNFC